MTVQTKCLAYAYATSPVAVKAGFGRSGCWIVTISAGRKTVRVTGYATEAEARAEFDKLPQAAVGWSR